MTVSTVAVCCDDLGLMSDARRLCAVAGLDVEVTGSQDASRWWSSAAAVLVDLTAAADLLGREVPRRGRVGLLARGDDPAGWRLAVALGAEQLAVLPNDERLLLDGVLDLRDSTSGAPVVGCLPATGGAGASTVASGLALSSARQGAATLLIDGDPDGGGLDLLFGLEHVAGVRWPDFSAATAASDGLPDGLPTTAHGLALLSWDRRDTQPADRSRSWHAVLPAARAANELVVVDLPRSVAPEAVATVDVLLLVVRAGVRPTVAAAQAAARLRPHVRDLRVVVRGCGRGDLGAVDVAAALGLPLAGQLVDDRRIAAAVEEGQLPRLLSRLPFDALAAELTGLRRTAA